MNKLALCLLLVVWITLAAADCTYTFGDKKADFSSVGTLEGTWTTGADTTNKIFANFCQNVSPSGKWNIYAVGKTGDEISFGSVDAAPLPVAASTGGVNTLTYNNSEADCYFRGYIPRTTIFTLTCSASTDSTFSVKEQDCVFNIALSVNCDGSSSNSGLSGGAIFLIVFFSLLAGYFIIGTLLCKFVFKKEGLDMIPQRAFWTALPGLFIAGVKYFIGCFTKKKGGDSGYHESYGATDEV